MDYPNKYKVIGLMSGTSLDGVDIVYCILKQYEGSWAYAIEVAQTVKYSSAWKAKLSEAHRISGEALIALHVEYGRYLGLLVNAFILKNKLRGIDFIASHGHTIFHQPSKQMTFQLGDGHALHAACAVPVVCDFRNMDVSLGGEGAPLVPVGDEFLFSEYDVCLNLGGIANLSVNVHQKRMAFDICFANMGLNFLAEKAGLTYDKQGKLAAGGEINKPLLNALNKVYGKFRKQRPSLGREIFEKHIKPLLDRDDVSLNDRLRTFTESTAVEILHAIRTVNPKASVLCTGGGALNSFLMYRMMELAGDDITLIKPEDDVIQFKEALVFAFLGVLRLRNEINCLRSVTGAKRNSSGGVVIGR